MSQKARYFNTIFILKHNKNFKSFFGMIINQKTTLLPRGDCKLPCFNHLKRHTSKIVPKTAGALRCIVPADQNMAAYNRSLPWGTPKLFGHEGLKIGVHFYLSCSAWLLRTQKCSKLPDYPQESSVRSPQFQNGVFF